ncbi:MAG: apolipoprotein N-acyltransferase [Deltaproteobacteria bacterium]|nr:apolipoprotein N-acyltransferase [Deltaproteobacteria bacterium]
MSQISANKNLLAIASGLLLTASFPPLKTDWLIWIALIPLLISINNETPKRAFRLGLITGLTHYVTLLYWIINVLANYGGLDMITSIFVLLLLALYLSLFTGAFSALITIKMHSRIKIFLFAAIWVSLEYLRTFFLTGFPWGLLGHSLYSRLSLIQIADITGVYGPSFIIAAVNISIFEIINQRRHILKNRYLIIETILLIVVFALSLSYGKMALARYSIIKPENTMINAAIIQGNIDQSVKWDISFQDKTIIKYSDMTKKSFNTSPDIVVWPETAVPLFFQDENPLTEIIYEIAKEGNTHLIFGSPGYKRDSDRILYYNTAWYISPEGEIKGKYSKNHLVPFGEYVPFHNLIPFVYRLVPSAGDFSKGESDAPLMLGSISSGILICYEAIFPDLAREQVRKGASIFINITNDAWFGYSGAPFQHLFISVFRAIENRRPMIRSANTGVSAIIDPRGIVTAQGDIFTDEIITGRVSTGYNEKTFYTRNGDIFALSLSIICLLIFFIPLFYSKASVKK